MDKSLKKILRDLARAEARLEDVKKRGDDAISIHDLRNGYDADFYLNRCPILQNQVNYNRALLKEALKDGIQTTIEF